MFDIASKLTHSADRAFDHAIADELWRAGCYLRAICWRHDRNPIQGDLDAARACRRDRDRARRANELCSVLGDADKASLGNRKGLRTISIVEFENHGLSALRDEVVQQEQTFWRSRLGFLEVMDERPVAANVHDVFPQRR